MPDKVVTMRSGFRLPCKMSASKRDVASSHKLLCAARAIMSVFFAARAMLCNQDAADRRAARRERALAQSGIK
jgi:hypothetical protein